MQKGKFGFKLWVYPVVAMAFFVLDQFFLGALAVGFAIEMCIRDSSDTHGDAGNLRRVLLQQRKAEVVIHLGDGRCV